MISGSRHAVGSSSFAAEALAAPRSSLAALTAREPAAVAAAANAEVSPALANLPAGFW